MSTPNPPAASTPGSKQVAGISNGKTALQGSGTGFSPPSAISTLQFTIAQLAGSIARATARSGASTTIVAALAMGAEELLKALVDTTHTDLSFLRDVEDLADSTRTTFSGNLGAGIMDLYMTSLGYSFRRNGRELVALPNKVFDVAYDGGATAGAGIVAAEAKGHIRAGIVKADVQKAAEDGYKNQVQQFVGKPLGTSKVLHGYGIAIGTQPLVGVKCDMYVQETGLPSIGSGGGGHASSTSPGGGGSGGSGGGPGSQAAHYEQVDSRVCLGNYRDAFRLMGGNGIVDAIEAAAKGQWNTALNFPQRFNIVQWRGTEYVVVPKKGAGRSPRANSFSASFGLRHDTAERFLEGLGRLIRQQTIPQHFPMEMPVRPVDVQREIQFADDGAEYPDGLAYFGGEQMAHDTAKLSWPPPGPLSNFGTLSISPYSPAYNTPNTPVR